ncbi:MAG: F0F1 ATP synthase subunit delta [Betaproteobacteria bacterium]|nr:F0F1 ATP synthase subunit delta [Betaproteobacteria bacterium]
MAEALTIARPYAEASFRLAKDQNALAAWSETLAFIARVAADPTMQRLIGDPNVTAGQVGDLFLGICGDGIPGEARNLILVLVENRRLPLLPHIVELYEELKAAQEGVREARIVSAFPMDGAELKTLVSQLEKRFASRIEAKVEVDRELIGGVKVEVGDEVVDASVRAQLEAMAVALQK